MLAHRVAFAVLVVSLLLLAVGCTCNITITHPTEDGNFVTSNESLDAEIEYVGSCGHGDCEITSFRAYLDDQDVTDLFTCSSEECNASAASLTVGDHVLRVDASLSSDTYMCREGDETDSRKLHVCSSNQWVHAYEIDRRTVIKTVRQTSDSGYIATGTKMGTESNDDDIFVMKLSQLGAVQWTRTYDGPDWRSYMESNDYVENLLLTADGGYIIIGWSAPHEYAYPDFYAWMIKLSDEGTVQWVTSLAPSSYTQFLYAVEQTDDDGDGQKDDGYVIVGETATSMPRDTDALVLKLDNGGNVQWIRRYSPGSEYTRAQSVQQTGDGGYVVAGNTNRSGWIIKLDFNGKPLWQKEYSGGGLYAIRQTADNGYIVAGAANQDGLILKLDGMGEIQWQKMYGGSGFDTFHSLQRAARNSYVAAGRTNSFNADGNSAWMLKINSGGDIVWQRTYGSIHPWIDHDVFHETSDNGYVLTTGTSIFKLNENGAVQNCNAIGQANALIGDASVIVQDAPSISGDPGLIFQSRTFDVGQWTVGTTRICCY